MLPPEKLNRLNELARKVKTSPLTEIEQAEQRKLREEYLTRFREQFRGHLDQIHVAPATPKPKKKSYPFGLLRGTKG